MNNKLITLLVATSLLFSVACSTEGTIPQPGDYDFIGPLTEEMHNAKEDIPQPGDYDFIGPLPAGFEKE